MGEAKLKMEIRERHARKIVEAFETFIDANIASALRQSIPECTSPKWDINELHNAREELVRILVVPPPKY